MYDLKILKDTCKYDLNTIELNIIKCYRKFIRNSLFIQSIKVIRF